MNDNIDYVNRLAHKALTEHGLEGWSVRWDRAKRRAGSCNHTTKVISFSRVLARIYPKDILRDVVMHEVAHAIAGPRAGHGPKWKKTATKLGATPKSLLPSSLPEPKAKWVGRCPACGAERHLHSVPRRVVACGKCGKGFSSDLIFEWEYDGSPTVPPGAYARELARIQAQKQQNRT